jgi:predicted amidohydrolase
MITDPNGVVAAQGPYFEEALVVHPIDLNQLHRTRSRLPLLRDERTGLMAQELQRILAGSQNGDPGFSDSGS